ncbi:MAG TPA: hypothetical protein DCY20_04225 [Firmicutes bacterium]|nr:hypothetical protein [Bacillota bacterium]
MENKINISALLQQNYGIHANEIIPLTDKVFKIITASKIYALKVSEKNDDFIMKQLFAYKAMSANVLPIYRTVLNEYEVVADGQRFYLTDYVLGIRVPLEKQIHYYVELLQKMHEKTRLVVDVSDEEISKIYQKEYKKLQNSYKILQKNMDNYELKDDRSPYEWYFMMVYPMIYSVLQRAHQELKQFYDELKSRHQMPISLVHGNVNIANVLVSENNTYLINFERSVFSLSVLDMYYFLENYHQVPGINSIIMDYIKKEEDPLLRHYFFFKSLLIDVEELEESLDQHSLTKIAVLNERVAPHMLAMQIYDTINKPTTATQAAPQE